MFLRIGLLIKLGGMVLRDGLAGGMDINDRLSMDLRILSSMTPFFILACCQR